MKGLLGSIAVAALVATLMCVVGSWYFIDYDSWWNLFIARQEGWSDFASELMIAELHPPLFFLVLKSSIGVLGSSSLAYRATGIAATLAATVLVVRVSGQVTRSAATAVAAGVAFGASTSAVMVGLRVHAYALCVALLLLAFSVYLDWLRMPARLSSGKRWLFGVSLSAAILTNYCAFIFLAGVIATPLLLCALDRSWRERLLPEFQQQRLGIPAMLVAPLLVALAVYTVHARAAVVRVGHVTPMLFDPMRESAAAFLARSLGDLAALFLPGVGTGGALLTLVGAGVAAAVVASTLHDGGRRRLGVVPLALLVVMLAINAGLALLGAYPFGGSLRHEFFLLPFALVSLFVALESARSLVPALASRPGLWAGLLALGVAGSLAVSKPGPLLDPTGERLEGQLTESLFKGQMDEYRRTLGTPAVVFVDQFSFILLFAHHHDWQWRLEDRSPPRFRQVWRVSRGERSFKVCRSAIWLLDLSDPATYAELAACRKAAGEDSVAVFRPQLPDFAAPSWSRADTRQLARRLARRVGLEPETVVVSGEDVYATFRAAPSRRRP